MIPFAHRAARPAIRPSSWLPIYAVREQGMVPAYLTIRLDERLPKGGNVVNILPGDDLLSLDLSCCAGIDVFVSFDGGTEPYRRMRDLARAILATNPASLTLFDSRPYYSSPKIAACLRRGAA